MVVFKFVLFGLFILTFCGYEAESASESNPNAIATIADNTKNIFKFMFTLPFKVAKHTIKFIFKLPKALFRTATYSVRQLFELTDDALLEIVRLIKDISAKLLDKLVSFGIFQGRAIKWIVSGLENLIINVISKIVKSITRINTTIVDILRKLFEELNLKDIKNRILNSSLLKSMKSTILDKIVIGLRLGYYRQVNQLENFMRYLYNKNDNFFTPLIKGLVSRLLIAYNSLCAIRRGSFKECPGVVSKDDSFDSIKQVLTYYGTRLKAGVTRFFGFSKQANKYANQADRLLDAIKSHKLLNKSDNSFGSGSNGSVIMKLF